MKLYKIYLNNGLEYEDNEESTFLKVFESVEGANSKADEYLEEFCEHQNGYGKPYRVVTEISNVDGYKVKLVKI